MKVGSKYAFGMCVVFAISAANPVFSREWKVNEAQSQVEFITKTGKHIRTIGTFKHIKGKLIYDAADARRASVSAQIPIATIETGVNSRDEDLISQKYFDVSKYPVAEFLSQNIVKSSADDYLLRGKLSLHGVWQPVSVRFCTPKIINGQLQVIGKATIEQEAFGLTLRQLHPDGAVWINKSIDVTIKLAATEQSSKFTPGRSRHLLKSN